MATVPFQYQAAGAGVMAPGALAVTLTTADDVSDWVAVDSKINLLCAGGSAMEIEVYRCTLADKSDAVLVDTQTHEDRTGLYEFVGPGYVQLKLVSVTGGPVISRITR